MDFGQELEANIYEPWRLHYVSYDAIRTDMQRRSLWTDTDEADFERLIRLEADKVDQFVTRKQREIDSRVAYCERTIFHQQQHLSAALALQKMYDSMDDALTEILIDLNDLSKYTRYNFLALEKLVQAHDDAAASRRRPMMPLLVGMMRSSPLDRQRFDTSLVKISTLHDICRLHGEARSGNNAAASADQNSFERATAKYWVHPDNVTELKAILLFNLPVLVFDPSKPIEPSDSAISSVYLDNKHFDLYTGRLQRDEGAEAIRLRWYGPMETPNVFVERKTHHAPWLNGVSVKDRFRLNAAKVGDYLTLSYSADQYSRDIRGTMPDETVHQNHTIAAGVQKSIRDKSLEPTMRVFYNRTAFQVPGDQRLRISLDTDLTFVREDEAMRRRGNPWRRDDMGINHPFANLPDADVCRFPYAVLETKIQTHLGQEPPEWLTRLLDSHLVYEVPRFSKYLHGAAHFWQSRLPLLPWWLSEMDVDIRNAKQSGGQSDFSGLSRSKSLKPLIDGKYRMGYLESALERQASQKGKKRKQQQEQPDLKKKAVTPLPIPPSSKSVTKPLPTMTLLQNDNPFDDPVWNSRPDSLDFGSFQHSTSSPTVIRSRLTPPPNTFVSANNSTDHLVRPISGIPTIVPPYEKPSSSPRDSVVVIEKGSEDYADEKKKNKKNKKDKKDTTVIEPKIYFANERTFINWLQFAAFILMASLTLINFGDYTSKIAGGVFFGIAMIMSLYAFGRYRYRAWQITNRPRIRYDDLYGPIGLCVLLVGALLLNLVIRLQQPIDPNPTFLSIGNQTRQSV